MLDDARLADILSSGTPDYAVTEMIRASLEAGSTDNVISVVADVVDGEAPSEEVAPVMVGAAAEWTASPRPAAPRKKGSMSAGTAR